MSDLAYILERIELKKRNFQQYDFSRTENHALATFFDLAQEFDDIQDFYRLCVAIPKSCFGLDCCLYFVHPFRNDLVLCARTEEDAFALQSLPPDDIYAEELPYCTATGKLVLTIRGKRSLIDQLPFQVRDDVLGLLVLYQVRNPTPHQLLFFQKFANRIGFNLHNRILDEKNIEHLKFIRSLVADIEHNIIVPNMVYKLFLKGLRAHIMKNMKLETLLSEYQAKDSPDKAEADALIKELSFVNQGLISELENLEKHFKNMSLFIETLFRKSHFDQGRLTLRTKQCNMKKDVVVPQLERYLEQFKKAGISIDDRLSSIPDEEIVTVVDIGLIAQVYANLFSNALKYTESVDIFGETKKYIAYGHQVIKDFFGEGRDGVKYNVFSSGPHIPPEERPNIFDEEFRGSNVGPRPGTGHGLAFIKNAVEMHRGVVGYEPVDYGNNFYFILPK